MQSLVQRSQRVERGAESDGANLEPIKGEKSVRASARDRGRWCFLVMSHSSPHCFIQKKFKIEPAYHGIKNIIGFYG